MNKKFLAALTSAALLFTTPGTIIFANEEMIESGAGAVDGSDVEQSTIELSEVNFPDENFRTSIKLAYSKAMNITDENQEALTASTVDATIPDGTQVKLEDLAKITTLATDLDHPGQAADYFDEEAHPFKNIIGVEYLTGLQYLSILNSPQLKEADLSKNENLEWIKIVPRQVAGANAPALSAVFTFAPNTDPNYPRHIQSSDLYSLVLPEETSNLTQLVLGGADQIKTLDLSEYSALEYLDVQLCGLEDLDVSGCKPLLRINVSGNNLTNLDLSNNSKLTAIRANDNSLYNVSFPKGKDLSVLTLYKNQLTTLDVTPFENLVILDVSDNRLEVLDLSNNPQLNALNVSYNHLASLDLSKNDKVKTATAPYTTNSETSNTKTPTITVSPQYLYANAGSSDIDLASYDENFQGLKDGVGWKNDQIVNGTITQDGLFNFSGDELLSSYTYQTGDETGEAMTVNLIQADLMNRLYNPNSGEHLYTADLNEKEVLVELGWQDEEIGWVAPLAQCDIDPVSAGKEVFRLYNPNTGDHHYTTDRNEKETLVRLGWDYEGIGWYSAHEYSDIPATTAASRQVTNYSIPVYRQYNPNATQAGSHNYTISKNENDVLVTRGWNAEGLGWWALK